MGHHNLQILGICKIRQKCFAFLGVRITEIIQIKGIATAGSWGIAVAALFVMLILTVILPVQAMKKEDSPYIIPEWQNEQFEKNMKRFHR